MNIDAVIQHQKSTVLIENQVMETLRLLDDDPESIELQSNLRRVSKELVSSHREFRRITSNVEVEA